MIHTIKAAFDFLRFHTVHMRSRAAIESWQEKRLRGLISHAKRNVPLYQKLYASYEPRPHISAMRDLQQLPIIRKQMFIGKPVEEYTDASTMITGRWVQTSGTSGTPFTPLRRPHVNAPFYRDSLHYRYVMWQQPWRLVLHGMRVAHIRVLPRNRPDNMVVSITDFLNDTEKALRSIAAFKPFIIEAHASLLYELARGARQYNIPLSPRYVVSVSEVLSPATRRLLESTLHTEVYNRYGLEEFGTVGVECRMHDGFHINAESFIFEIVDDAGAPVPDGMPGRVLITDLFNESMPFIRYETGDRGRISWKKCACGISAPRVWIDGRHVAYMTLSFDNRRIHHFDFTVALEHLMHQILHFQVAKTGPDAVAVRIIPGSSFTDATRTAIRESILPLIGERTRLSIECVESFARLPGGKVPVVVDETTGANARV